jgi:protein Tex
LNGDDVLDASAVHPEAYPLVRRIAEATGRDVPSLVGDAAFLRQLDPTRFADERFGLLTVRDILLELEKPGRDPRPVFRTARFSDAVHTLSDLQPGLTLEGVVTNVANFGAFVDIGVHHDGLVHVSQLADRFVKDPRDVVKTGDIVTVNVLEVDLPRQRIALTMRRGERPDKPATRPTRQAGRAEGAGRPPAAAPKAPAPQRPTSTTMAAAFDRLRRDR